MLAAYLAALVFGWGTALLQLFHAPHAGDDAGGHQLETGNGHGGDGHGGGGDGDGSGHHGHADAKPGGAGAWSILLSLRFYVFAAIGFGTVGAPATWLRLAPGLTLAVAVLVGLLVGTLAALGFRALSRQTLSSGTHAPELVGQVGRVLVTCEPGRLGKVRLIVRGQMLDFVASTEEPSLAPGTAVIVQEVRSDGVQVCAAPRELLPE